MIVEFSKNIMTKIHSMNYKLIIAHSFLETFSEFQIFLYSPAYIFHNFSRRSTLDVYRRNVMSVSTIDTPFETQNNLDTLKLYSYPSRAYCHYYTQGYSTSVLYYHNVKPTNLLLIPILCSKTKKKENKN